MEPESNTYVQSTDMQHTFERPKDSIAIKRAEHESNQTQMQFMGKDVFV
jgi:hypothetical protein